MNILTGIKSSGMPHLGNYISAIKPIIDNYNEDNDYYCMIADAHTLTSQPSSENLKQNIMDVALTWSSLLKDEKNIFIYRQSKIPEIFELFWILSCFTAKGLLNRNHTYKSMTEINRLKSKDDDKGIFMGLYNYPILMGADILLFNTNNVPIGKDQEQHMECIIDIAKKINYFYKTNLFKIPLYTIKENVVLNSYDGRKMSKSYNNNIPIFCNEENLKKYIYKYKTSSKTKTEIKYKEETELSNLVKYICNNYQYIYYLDQLHLGKSWKEIKDVAFNMINDNLKKYRENYNYLLDHKLVIENMLLKNEVIIKSKARKKLTEIKMIMGMI